jgi:hypothetical protein
MLQTWTRPGVRDRAAIERSGPARPGSLSKKWVRGKGCAGLPDTRFRNVFRRAARDIRRSSGKFMPRCRRLSSFPATVTAPWSRASRAGAPGTGHRAKPTGHTAIVSNIILTGIRRPAGLPRRVEDSAHVNRTTGPPVNTSKPATRVPAGHRLWGSGGNPPGKQRGDPGTDRCKSRLEARAWARRDLNPHTGDVSPITDMNTETSEKSPVQGSHASTIAGAPRPSSSEFGRLRPPGAAAQVPEGSPGREVADEATWSSAWFSRVMARIRSSCRARKPTTRPPMSGTGPARSSAGAACAAA